MKSLSHSVIVDWIIILLFYSELQVINTSVVDFVEPIRTVLDYLDVPVRVHVMCCWDVETRLKFFRAFQKIYPTEVAGGFSVRSNNRRNYQLAISDISVENFPKAVEEHQQLILIDLNCNETTNAFLHQIDMKITQHYRWIALDNYNNNDDGEILAAFRDLPVLPNSQVICIRKVRTNYTDDFVFKEVYRTSMACNLILELFGFYRNSKFTDERSNRITIRRRRDLCGATLRATLVLTNNDSINHLADAQDIQIDTISKVNFVLTNQLGDYVNANIVYTFASSWGYMDPEKNQWSGMIGDLVDNRSDIGASALFFTTDRVRVIDYIAMPTPTRSKFVFRSPKLSYTDNVFLLPFDELVWLSILVLVILTSFALMVTTWTEWKLKGVKTDMDPGILRPSMLDSLILVFGATCQQGSAVTPRSPTSRLIMFLVFLILMFLYTSYSANIVALLQSPSQRIKTLNDLLNSRLKLGADDTVFNRYYFTHTTERVRQKIYQQKILNKDGTENFMPLSDGVALLREGLFAFHMETGVGYKLVSETFLEDEKCGLQEIQYLQVIDPWYAIQKNSSYKELLKIGMMRIHEHGLQERENAILYTKKPKCSAGGGKFITASLVDTRPAMLTLLWGYLLAVSVFALEMAVHRRIQQNN